MLQAAHYDHERHNGHYDDLDNGRMLCVDCHLAEHCKAFNRARTTKERNRHAFAIRKLKRTTRYNYLYSEKPIEKN